MEATAARQSATQDRPIYNAFGRRMAQVRYVIEARAKDPICRYVSRAGFISYHHKNAAKYKTAAEAESDTTNLQSPTGLADGLEVGSPLPEHRLRIRPNSGSPATPCGVLGAFLHYTPSAN